MKDKEKQFEEMREHICIGCSGKPCGEYCDKCKFVAEELLKHYQPKLSEDSVVLTREDMKKYAEDCIAGQETGLDIINGLIARAERYKEKAKQERKETAREIFSTVITYPVFSFTAKTLDYTEGYMQAIDDYRKQIKKIAKEEFGVEIKE